MRYRTVKRALSLLLALAMVLPMLNLAVLAEEVQPPPAQGETQGADALEAVRQLREAAAALGGGNTAQSDDLYLFGGKDYKVIHNDYIACYVSAADGSFTVLPTADEFDPGAGASRAVFTIDGEEHVFGEGGTLVRPQVRDDMVATDWAVGDYVISQYQAITLDEKHENSYAVKVAYAAEYFGEGESEVSGRIVLAARLGEDGQSALTTGGSAAWSGGLTLTPAPAELWAAEGEGPHDFFVLDEKDYLPVPERLSVGERSDLLADGGFVPEEGAALSDPAAAFYFAPRTVRPPAEDEEDRNTNLASFLVNYGFYGLEEHAPELTVDAEAMETDEALGKAADVLLEQAAAAKTYRFSVETSWASMTNLSYQMPGDPEAIQVPEDWREDGGELYFPAGATVRFRLALSVPERTQLKEVSYVTDADREPVSLTPGGDGSYTLVMPEQVVSLMADVEPKAGYAFLSIDSAVFELEAALTPAGIQDPDSPLNAVVKSGESIGVTLSSPTQPLFVPGNTDADSYGLSYRADGPNQPIPMTSGSGEPGEDGVVRFGFTVPQVSSEGRVRILVNQSADYHFVSTKVAPRAAVAGGDLVTDAPRINGISRVKPETPVSISLPTLTSGYNPADTWLSVINLSDNSYVQINSYTTGPVALADFTSNQETAAEFTMPDADVEVRLAAGAYHKVFTKVTYLDVASLPVENVITPVAVSVQPDSPEEGDTVTVRLEYLYDPYAPKYSYTDTRIAADNASLTTVAKGLIYTFVMPDKDVTVKVDMIQSTQTPTPVHTLSTAPLVEGGTLRYGVWARQAQDKFSAANTPLSSNGTSVQVPKGAAVEYYCYPADPSDTRWQVKQLYLASPDDLSTPLIDPATDQPYALKVGYANPDTNQGYHTFTMPDQDAVIVARGGADPYEIKVDPVYVLAAEVEEDMNGPNYQRAPKYPMTVETGSGVYYVNNQGGTPSGLGDVTLTTAAKAGDQLLAVGRQVGGYTLKALYLLRDGWEPLDLMKTASFDSRFSGHTATVIMPGQNLTLQPVYQMDAPVTLVFQPPADAQGLTLSASASQVLNANYNPETDTYSFSTEITLYNSAYNTRAYTLEQVLLYTGVEVDGSGVRKPWTVSLSNGGTLTVTPLAKVLDSTKQTYRLDASWSKDQDEHRPGQIRLPIYSHALSAYNADLIAAVPNHSSYEKARVITVICAGWTDEMLQKDLYLTHGTEVYKVNWAKAKVSEQCVRDENGTYSTIAIDTKAEGALTQENGAPLDSPFAFATGSWGLKGSFTTTYVMKNADTGELLETQMRENTKRVFFTLYDSPLDYSSPNRYTYLSIYKNPTDPGHTMRLSQSEAQAREDYLGAPPELTLSCEQGFFADNPDDPGQVEAGFENRPKDIYLNGSLHLSTRGSGSLVLWKGGGEHGYNLNLKAERMSLYAGGVPLFVSNNLDDTTSTLNMVLEEDTPYTLNPAGGGTAPALTPEGDYQINIAGYEGFQAGVDAYVLTTNNVDISGHLYLRWPFVEEPFGGLELDRLSLGLNGKKTGMGASMDGIRASGSFEMPNLYVIGGEAEGTIDTFGGYYRFQVGADLFVFHFNGELELIPSRRFWGLVLPNKFVVNFGAIKGIPLVPPAPVGEISGATAGIDHIVETLDFNGTETLLPPLELIIGGEFGLLEVIAIEAVITSGFYSIDLVMSGGISVGNFSIGFVEAAELAYGIFPADRRPNSSLARTYVKLAAGIKINALDPWLAEAVVGELSLETGIKFDNPIGGFQYLWENRNNGATLDGLIRTLGVEFILHGTMKAEISIPRILFFPKFRIRGGEFTFDAWLEAWNHDGARLGSARLTSVDTYFGMDFYASLELMPPYNRSTLRIGIGEPPTTARSARSANAVSLMAADGLEEPVLELGEGASVVAYSDGPTAEASAAALMDDSAPAVSIYSTKEQGMFAQRFTLPDDGHSYLLTAQQLGDWSSQPGVLRLYGADGREIPLNPWIMDGTSAVSAQDAKFRYNAMFGEGTWLISLPATGEELTLLSSLELNSAILAEAPVAKAGELTLDTSAAPAALSGENASRASEMQLSIPLEHLKDSQHYAYSINLVRRDTPDGEPLETLELPLGVTGEGDARQYVYRLPYEKGDVAGDVITADIKPEYLPLTAAGNYYPQLLLYRNDNPGDSSGKDCVLLDNVRGYTPYTVADSIFTVPAATVTAVSAGPNQSVDVRFTGVAGSADYAAVTAAGYQVSAYDLAVYGEDGMPATTLMPMTDPQAQEGDAVTYAPTPVTGRVSAAFDPDTKSELDYTANLAGLEPGTYTVRVTPAFTATQAGVESRQSMAGMEIPGKDVESSPVTLQEAVVPDLEVTLSGGKVERDADGNETYFVTGDFTLTLHTKNAANLSITRYWDGRVLAAANNTELELNGEKLFTGDLGGGFETLMITATDPTTLGTASRLITVVPDLYPPSLLLDNIYLPDVSNVKQASAPASVAGVATTSANGDFTISGHTEPGAALALVNASEPVAATAQADGSFVLTGRLPVMREADDNVMAVIATGRSGLSTMRTVRVERLSESDFTALELLPGSASLVEGETLALVTLGVKPDGTKVGLTPNSVTLTATGAHTVDSDGVLTAGVGSGTVTATLGSLTSNAITISGETAYDPHPDPDPGPAPSGGGGTSTYQVTVAPAEHGSVEISTKSAAKGKTVTITPKPDAGYAVDTVLVADSKSEKVPVAKQADGTYTFTMPGRAVTVTVTFKPDIWENPFTDVAESDWFYPYVAYVHQKGLFTGTSDTAFSPNVTMSRAMLWTVLARLDGQDTTGGTTWYEKGRAWAMAEGISDGTDPEGPVTREQVAAMLYRYAEAKGTDVSGRADLSKFGDASSVSTWAAEALAWASAGGIVTGKPGVLLDPQGKASRAEVAAMLQRSTPLF